MYMSEKSYIPPLRFGHDTKWWRSDGAAEWLKIKIILSLKYFQDYNRVFNNKP